MKLGLFWSATGGAYRPIATRYPSLGPFPSISGGAHRPLTTHASFLCLLALLFPLYFPFLSLGRLCQRSPRTFPVSLLCVGLGGGVGGLS